MNRKRLLKSIEKDMIEAAKPGRFESPEYKRIMKLLDRLENIWR